MESMIRMVTIAGAASVALVATGEARAQVPTQEVYQLERLSGVALPAVTEEAGECRDELLGATLTLETGGRWLLVTRERETCGETVEEEDDQENGRYTLDGARIRFLDDDGNPPEPDEDDDAELETDDLVAGTRSGTGLIVTTTDGETELQFRR